MSGRHAGRSGFEKQVSPHFLPFKTSGSLVEVVDSKRSDGNLSSDVECFCQRERVHKLGAQRLNQATMLTSNEAEHESRATEQVPVSSLLDVCLLLRADVLANIGELDHEEEDGEREAEETDGEVDVLYRSKAVVVLSREDCRTADVSSLRQLRLAEVGSAERRAAETYTSEKR